MCQIVYSLLSKANKARHVFAEGTCRWVFFSVNPTIRVSQQAQISFSTIFTTLWRNILVISLHGPARQSHENPNPHASQIDLLGLPGVLLYNMHGV